MQRTLAALTLAALSLPAAAQSSWYLGFNAGQAQTDNQLVTNRESTITGTVAGSLATRFDDKDSAWKALVGYRITDWLAIEASYADLGDHSTDTTFLGGDPTAQGRVIIRRQVKGFGLDAVLSAPVAGMFTVFGRVGAFRADLDASAELGGNVVFTGGNGETFRSTSQKETVARFGAGLEVPIARNISGRFEWERYSNVGKRFEVGGSGTTGEADMDVLSLGVVARFR